VTRELIVLLFWDRGSTFYSREWDKSTNRHCEDDSITNDITATSVTREPIVLLFWDRGSTFYSRDTGRGRYSS